VDGFRSREPKAHWCGHLRGLRQCQLLYLLELSQKTFA
jgi:hypothetical protein